MNPTAQRRLFCALAVMVGGGTAPAASPPDKPYQPPLGQRAVQETWNGVEYIYEGDWVPEFIYKRDADKRDLENPRDFQAPGDWRSESRPGYRARPTPQSVEFYRYVMEKAGRGEDINMAESMIIRRMIENRTWPEAPTIQDSDRGAAEWANQQASSEDSSVLTDPGGWSRKKNADLIYEQLTRSGRTDQDTPTTEGVEKFRQYWQNKTPEEKKNLPLGRWMKNYLVSKGYDMRSDEERADDDSWQQEKEEKAQRDRDALAEAERQQAEEKEREVQRQRDWFKEKWAEEDRRIAEQEARERLAETIRRGKEDPPETAPVDSTANDDELPEETDPAPEAAGVAEADEDMAGDDAAPADEAATERSAPDQETARTDQPEAPDTEPEAETADVAGDTPEEDQTNQRRAEKKGATDDPAAADADDSAEADESAAPDSYDAPAAETSPGEFTETKGYVEGKDGRRITLTETRDADGNITRSTETETDADGQVTSQTTYVGGSGEGKTTRPGSNLRDAEPPADADVDVDLATDGYTAADDFSGHWTDSQQQRGADSSMTMAQNTQMDESSNFANQQLRDAKATRDSGGRDARNIQDDATRNVNKADRQQSWGKAIGDAVESGITEGGKAFGQAIGQGAADRAVGEIFGSDEEDSPAAESGAETKVASASAAAAADGGGSEKTPAKKKPSSSAKSDSSCSTACSGGSSSAKPKPQTTSSSSSDVWGHCPICGRTDLVEHVIDCQHDWRCPVCNVTGHLGPPPAGLGSGNTASSTTSTSAPSSSSTATTAPAPPAPKKTRQGCPVCKAPVTYRNDHYLYGSVYRCDQGHSVKGRDLVTVEIE